VRTSRKRPAEKRRGRARRLMRSSRASRCAHRNKSRGGTRARRSACFVTRARSGLGAVDQNTARTQIRRKSRDRDLGIEEDSARVTGCGVSRTVDSGRIREGTLAPPLDGVSKLVVARARGSSPARSVPSFFQLQVFSATSCASSLRVWIVTRANFFNLEIAPRVLLSVSPRREEKSGRPEAPQPRGTSRISRDVPPRPKARVSGFSHDEYARSRSDAVPARRDNDNSLVEKTKREKSIFSPDPDARDGRVEATFRRLFFVWRSV
jgi:hypothetical protein